MRTNWYSQSYGHTLTSVNMIQDKTMEMEIQWENSVCGRDREVRLCSGQAGVLDVGAVSGLNVSVNL